LVVVFVLRVIVHCGGASFSFPFGCVHLNILLDIWLVQRLSVIGNFTVLIYFIYRKKCPSYVARALFKVLHIAQINCRRSAVHLY
jgi:hypothetical protein